MSQGIPKPGLVQMGGLGIGLVRLIVPSLRAGVGPDLFQLSDFWLYCWPARA